MIQRTLHTFEEPLAIHRVDFGVTETPRSMQQLVPVTLSFSSIGAIGNIGNELLQLCGLNARRNLFLGVCVKDWVIEAVVDLITRCQIFQKPLSYTVACKIGFTLVVGIKVLLRHIDKNSLLWSNHIRSRPGVMRRDRLYYHELLT